MTGEQKPGGLSEAWRVLRKTFSDRFEDGNDHEIERMEAAVAAAEPAEARIRELEAEKARLGRALMVMQEAVPAEYRPNGAGLRLYICALKDRATAAEAKLAALRGGIGDRRVLG